MAPIEDDFIFTSDFLYVLSIIIWMHLNQVCQMVMFSKQIRL